MENNIKELIAIGASVVANCQPCLTYHINKAKEYGVEEADISTAITTAKMVRKGAMEKMDKFISTQSNVQCEHDENEKKCGCR